MFIFHTITSWASEHFDLDSSQPRILNGLGVLDVGCGGGLLSESLARLGATVTGIDAAYESIEVAKEHARVDKSTRAIRYLNTPVEDLVLSEAGSFDIVCALEVCLFVVEALSLIDR